MYHNKASNFYVPEVQGKRRMENGGVRAFFSFFFFFVVFGGGGGGCSYPKICKIEYRTLLLCVSVLCAILSGLGASGILGQCISLRGSHLMSLFTKKSSFPLSTLKVKAEKEKKVGGGQ